LLALNFIVFLPWWWIQGQKQTPNRPVLSAKAEQEAITIAVSLRKGSSSSVIVTVDA
jgi:hypothetical protein